MNKNVSKDGLRVVSNEPIRMTEEEPLDNDSNGEKEDQNNKESENHENKSNQKEPAGKSNEDGNQTNETVNKGEKPDKVSGEKTEKDSDEKTEKGVSEVPKREADSPPPPPAPPRPLSPVSSIRKDLKEAFPNLDDRLVNGIIIASQGIPEPAYNALLYISDPSTEFEFGNISRQRVEEDLRQKGHSMEEDEVLARRLQRQYEGEVRARRARERERGRGKSWGGSNPEEEQSGDEFDQFRESVSNGLEGARSTLNGWVSGLARRWDGNTQRSGDESPDSRNSRNPKLFGALSSSSFNFSGPRSNNENKTNFDEDPQIISNDFHDRITLQNNTDKPPGLPSRRNNFQDDQLNKNKGPRSYDGANEKWKPLSSNEPLNSDAFLVSDSEEEREHSLQF